MAIPNRKPRPWVVLSKRVVLRGSAETLADVTPLLARVVEALGTNAAARLLGADRAQVSRWNSRRESIGAEMGRRIVDLHDVLTRILRIYGPEPAAMWLVGSEPLLGGARPIDVLVTEGASPVIRAIDGIAAGAYAQVTHLYRVFPYLPKAKEDEPGGALFVPSQGGGRIDNADAYSVLYLSDAPAGAIAEAFGRFPEWTRSLLDGSPNLPGSVRALGEYTLAGDARICDLDDPKQLLALGLKPSDIVSRDYLRSRAWARRIYDQRAWAGVRWWSYYDSRWSSFGLWDTSGLRLADVAALTLEHAALLEASRAIVRRVIQG